VNVNHPIQPNISLDKDHHQQLLSLYVFIMTSLIVIIPPCIRKEDTVGGFAHPSLGDMAWVATNELRSEQQVVGLLRLSFAPGREGRSRPLGGPRAPRWPLRIGCPATSCSASRWGVLDRANDQLCQKCLGGFWCGLLCRHYIPTRPLMATQQTVAGAVMW